MIGIICNDSLKVVGHSLFNNFRLALYNTFGQDKFIEIKSTNDINSDLKYLFIVDEHFAPNVETWKNDNFINKVNDANIKVITFNFERIYNSHFPWNVSHQDNLNKFNNLYQIVSDADDATMLHKQIVNKQFLSKDTDFKIEKIPFEEKSDVVLFLGQLNGNQYTHRRNVIKNIVEQNKNINFEILASNRKQTYQDFLNKVNKHKYLLNPFGTGKFINLRHYEALYFDVVPIQEINDDVLKWYNDINDNCITFNNDYNIQTKIQNFSRIENKQKYLEDFFKEINLTL